MGACPAAHHGEDQRMGTRLLSFIVALLLLTSAAQAVTPEQKCQSGKNKAAGKYAYCRQKTEAKFVTTGDLAIYGILIDKCEAKFASKWQSLIDATTAAGTT